MRLLAAERGLSISVLVSDGVGILLTRKEQGVHRSGEQRAIAAAGRFHSGRSDVARRHDDFLVSACETSRE